MNEADVGIAVLAESQFGVFSRAQAAAAGLSEYAMSRRVVTGRWVEVFPAVYRLPGAGRTGRQRAMAAVQRHGERAIESRLEVKLARLIRTSPLPKPARQHPVGRFRLDFAWPAARIACECDGFEHHGARLAWKRDWGRLAEIEAGGWRVVHVTWDDATREPDRTLDRLALALRAATQARMPASVRAARAGSSCALVSSEIRWTRSP